MTRKKYDEDTEDENGNGNDPEVNSDVYDSDYDSDEEFLEIQREEIENFEREIFEERNSLEWWRTITSYPELYHLKNLSYSWFEELLETGVRPYQCQVLFPEYHVDYIFEPVPDHLLYYGITQEIWQLLC